MIHQDLFEILQPHKGARPDVVKTDIDKCKSQSNHGDVVKDEYEQQAGNEHEQKCAVLFDPLKPGRSGGCAGERQSVPL